MRCGKVLQSHGAQADCAEMVASTFARRDGEAGEVSPHVQQVTGYAATAFADFANRSADAWR